MALEMRCPRTEGMVASLRARWVAERGLEGAIASCGGARLVLGSFTTLREYHKGEAQDSRNMSDGTLLCLVQGARHHDVSAVAASGKETRSLQKAGRRAQMVYSGVLKVGYRPAM